MAAIGVIWPSVTENEKISKKKATFEKENKKSSDSVFLLFRAVQIVLVIRSLRSVQAVKQAKRTIFGTEPTLGPTTAVENCPSHDSRRGNKVHALAPCSGKEHNEINYKKIKEGAEAKKHG